jgi:hypothetical protein
MEWAVVVNRRRQDTTRPGPALWGIASAGQHATDPMAAQIFQTTPKEKGPAEAGPSTWGMRKEGFSSAAKQSGARETVRVISKENRTVSFQQQKMWRCCRKGPAMATAGPVRVLVCPPRFLPQSACLLSPASGDVRCHWTLRQRRRG